MTTGRARRREWSRKRAERRRHPRTGPFVVKSGGVLLRGHQYADRFVIFDARAEDQGPKSFVWIDQLEQLLKEVE